MAEEALARLRVECVEATQQLQNEIRLAAEAAELQQRQLDDLESRLTALTVAADAAAAARGRTEQELARMRATLTWRLRSHLVRIRSLRLALTWSRRLKRVLL